MRYRTLGYVVLLFAVGFCQPGCRRNATLFIKLDESICDFVSSDLAKVLEEYVDIDGRVDYLALSQDEASLCALDCFLKHASTVDVDSFDDSDARRAFYLNVHNVATMRGVLEYYPFEELSDCKVDICDKVLFNVGGQWLSLNAIGQLCQQGSNQRVAFAVSRPCLSGPYPWSKVYDAAKLDTQLDIALARYLGSCAGVQVDHDKQRVLFGHLILDRSDYFLENYQQRFDQCYLPGQVKLISAMIPWANPATRRQLSNITGYRVGAIKSDDRLNDIDRDDDDTDDDDDDKQEYQCGIAQ